MRILHESDEPNQILGLKDPEKYTDVISEFRGILEKVRPIADQHTRIFQNEHTIGEIIDVLSYDQWMFQDEMPDLREMVIKAVEKLRGAEANVKFGGNKIYSVTMTGVTRRFNDGSGKPFKYQCITDDGKTRYVRLSTVLPYSV